MQYFYINTAGRAANASDQCMRIELLCAAVQLHRGHAAGHQEGPLPRHKASRHIPQGKETC